MTTKALLFDMDGVIIDSEDHYDRLTAKVLHDLGYTYDREGIKLHAAGKSNAQIGQLIVDKYHLNITAEAFNALRRPLIEKVYEEEADYIEGFEEFYKTLITRHPLPTAIVTGSGPRQLNAVSIRLDFAKHFGDHIYSTHEVENHKPAPDGYLHAARALGVEAKDCLVFEDAPMGIIAALRAGAHVIAMTTTFTKEQIKNAISHYEAPGKEGIVYLKEFNEESVEKIEKLFT